MAAMPLPSARRLAATSAEALPNFGVVEAMSASRPDTRLPNMVRTLPLRSSLTTTP
ncbi:hypothetical protein D9M68_959860 [compost metagenome]